MGPLMMTFWKRIHDSFFQIYTNGQLIDKKVAAKLAELGNALPCISVEGFEKETDERRGKGAPGKKSCRLWII
ncbi:MAG: radical SAM protein [Actinomycetota bacterium]|nr:radical SAM protein [Actinomycetota bacterium]